MATRELSPDEVKELGLDDEGPGALETAIRGAGQGATFNHEDELVGGAKALFHKYIKNDPRALVELYRQERDAERQKNADAEESNPVLYHGAEFVGGAAPMLIPGVGEYVAGGGLLRAAGTGAAMGALAGEGASESEDKTGMVKDALEGAIGGAAGGVVGHELGGLAKGVMKKLPGKFATASDNAILRAAGQDVTEPFDREARAAILRGDKEPILPDRQTAAEAAGTKRAPTAVEYQTLRGGASNLKEVPFVQAGDTTEDVARKLSEGLDRQQKGINKNISMADEAILKQREGLLRNGMEDLGIKHADIVREGAETRRDVINKLRDRIKGDQNFVDFAAMGDNPLDSNDPVRIKHEKLGDLLQASEGHESMWSGKDVAKALDEEVLQPMAKDPTVRQTYRDVVQNQIEQFKHHGPMTVQDLDTWKQDFQKLVKNYEGLGQDNSMKSVYADIARTVRGVELKMARSVYAGAGLDAATQERIRAAVAANPNAVKGIGTSKINYGDLLEENLGQASALHPLVDDAQARAAALAKAGPVSLKGAVAAGAGLTALATGHVAGLAPLAVGLAMKPLEARWNSTLGVGMAKLARLAARDPMRLGKWGPYLQSTMAKGGADALKAAHYSLTQSSPEYAAISRQAMDEPEPQQSLPPAAVARGPRMDITGIEGHQGWIDNPDEEDNAGPIPTRLPVREP